MQIGLGLLWLLDGVLQLQPFMLRTSFARQILEPAAAGQPHFVSAAVHWTAALIAAHPVAWDIPFAAIQLLLGIAMLSRRTVRIALAASIPWALGVWFFGEGLSGLASGTSSLLSGAPGAVLLYAVLALAAWPTRGRSDLPPARWLPLVWATLWIGAAIIQVLPQNATGAGIADAVRANGSPSFMKQLGNSLAVWSSHHGALAVIALATVEVAIGLTALDQRTVHAGAIAGLIAGVAIWVVAENIGGLYTGKATDPNTGPLIWLMAIAVLSSPSPAGLSPPMLRGADTWIDSDLAAPTGRR